MSKLYFKVGSDWQEVVRLRNEITKLEAQIKSMDANKAPQAVAVLNTQNATGETTDAGNDNRSGQSRGCDGE